MSNTLISFLLNKDTKFFRTYVPVIVSTMHDLNSYLQINDDDDEKVYVEINVLKSRNCIANMVKLL